MTRAAKDKILVVGGYGALGGRIAVRLHGRFPQKVVVAGRNEDKARQFAAGFKGSMGFRVFDAFSKAQMEQYLPEIKLVINTVDMQSPYLLGGALKYGCDYIDATAGRRFLDKALALEMNAAAVGRTCVVGVGLIPGASNLMAGHCARSMESVDDIVVSALFDLNDQVGQGFLKHFMSLAPDPFVGVENNAPARHEGFSDPVETQFPDEFGVRSAYRFGFADQFYYPRTLGARTASGRISFLSPTALTAMSAATRVGCIGFLVRGPWFNFLTARLAERGSSSEGWFCIKADVAGRNMGVPTGAAAGFWGVGLENGAAAVCAELAAMIYGGELANPGVSLPEELPVSVPTFFARLARGGFGFQLD